MTKAKLLSAKLTIDPRQVNSNITTQNISDGLVLAGSVASVEDHGYVIDIGMKQLKAFVSKKAARMFCDDVTRSQFLLLSIIYCVSL